MTVAPTTGVSKNANESRATSGAEAEGGFRSHLARALSGAARVAGAVAPASPGAGVLSSGLSGISRVLDKDAASAPSKQDELQRALTDSQSSNARYIALQARMQAESQAFTAVSNILRSRHESAQTALNNIR